MRRTAKTANVITLRLGEDVVSAVDREARRVEQEQPGLTVTRTDIVRVLLNEAIEARGKRREGRKRARA